MLLESWKDVPEIAEGDPPPEREQPTDADEVIRKVNSGRWKPYSEVVGGNE